VPAERASGSRFDASTLQRFNAPSRGGSKSQIANRKSQIQGGFSFISIIGVAAILAILTAALLPNIIRRIDQAARDRETQDLDVMARGLVHAVKIEKRIPAVTGMPGVIANYRALALSQVTTNARRFARVFLVNANIGGETLQSNPYVQGNTAPTTRPASARVMVLSTLATPTLPSVNPSDFDSIWNTPEGTVPSALGSRDVYDLKIQRLDLAKLFHRVHLHNMDGAPARYTFNTNDIVAVPSTTLRTVYALEGSALNLYTVSGNTTNLQFREILIEDQSFVYQNGKWSRDLSSPKISPTLGPFGNLVAQFLNAQWNTAANGAENGARPQAAIETMFNYMLEYIIWSQGDLDPTHGIPPWQGAGEQSAAPQFPYFNRMQDAQTQLAEGTDNLIK
jgi:type II secretory pathway pseudopilin PulG